MTDSRAALLAAATEEFAKTGLRGTRIQAIVKRAGVNERMIYHHFGSKEGLYQAVIDEQRAILAQEWAPALEQAAGMAPYEGMRTALAGLFGLLQARHALLALLLHEALAGSRLELSMPAAEELPKAIRDLYERGQRAGVFRTDTPFELAYATAMAAIVALRVLAPPFAAQHWPARPELRDQVVELLLDGMTGPAKTG